MVLEGFLLKSKLGERPIFTELASWGEFAETQEQRPWES